MSYYKEPIIKEIMLGVAKVMFPSEKDKHVKEALNSVPMSINTVTARLEDLSDHFTESLVEELAKA